MHKQRRSCSRYARGGGGRATTAAVSLKAAPAPLPFWRDEPVLTWGALGQRPRCVEVQIVIALVLMFICSLSNPKES
jgi:hypothetical protein